ncbi:BRCA1-associated protein [Dioscorea alata]|uniref:BRCA1-associated protein n=1 Tax=Dioscorea alata TaxID=55571 RepID=A0ACB7UHM7_DIOAL|nr:BRCA1-associated protein [Dioscorea alata]
MFRLRVHSVDQLHPPENAGGATTSNQAPPPSPQNPNPNPRIQVRRGVIYLYHPTRSPSASSSSSLCHPPLESLLPSQRSTLLFALAVPTRVSIDDFLRFCHPYSPACEILIIRNDAVEDLYSVVVRFDEQESADRFYCDLNGWRLSDTEPEVCHILFLDFVEFTEYTEIASTPPIGFTELPTCPACLEKLDQDISGIVATTFDQFLPSTSKWFNSCCLVCQFLQEHTLKATCSTCHTSEHLWICLICGFVGCGRYKEGHARDHWGDTHHCYALDPHAQRIWDYVGDTYVHRLNQSRSADKFQSRCRFSIDNCASCECSDDSCFSRVLYVSQVEALKDEYNHLLANTLDEQKQHYEALLSKIEEDKEKNISEALETALSLRLQDIQLKLENSIKERKIAADTNEELMKNQSLLREKMKEIEERQKAAAKLKDEKIHELEEEIRDFTVFIEAQKVLDTVGGSNDIKGGTVLPVTAPQPSAGRSRRPTKLNRKRT